jgi:hypothetical protein
MTLSVAPPLVAALLAAPPLASVEYPLSAQRAERTMADFSKCVVADRRLRPWAEWYLRVIPEGAFFQAAARRLATPACMPPALVTTKLRFKAKLFRETLFSALYQRDFGRTPPPELKSVPPLVIAAEFSGDEAQIPVTVTFERAVGDCVARADPLGVHRLLMTKVASREEGEALQQVVPELAGCVPAGQRRAFSRPVLRGILAEALYKLRRAASASATLVQAGAH